MLIKEGVKDKISEWFPIDMQYWNCCKAQKGYAGTAIFVSKIFGGQKPIKVTYDIGETEEERKDAREHN